MIHTENGFIWNHIRFTPYVSALRGPHSPPLFQCTSVVGLHTAHPGFVKPIIGVDDHILGYKIDFHGLHGLIPEVNGGDVYGIETSPDRDRDLDRGLLSAALSAIMDCYCKNMIHFVVASIKLGSFNTNRFKNLTVLSLSTCALTQFPPFIVSLESLVVLTLSDNPQLEELPYDFLNLRLWQLHTLNLYGTGVKCIWTRVRKDPRGYKSWTLPDDLPRIEMSDLSAMKKLCVEMGEPAVRAATAIMVVQRRGIIKNFHRDVARLIAGMIMRTRGRAEWRPVYDTLL